MTVQKQRATMTYIGVCSSTQAAPSGGWYFERLNGLPIVLFYSAL